MISFFEMSVAMYMRHTGKGKKGKEPLTHNTCISSKLLGKEGSTCAKWTNSIPPMERRCSIQVV